jgi:hypothetical protein
MSCCKEENKCCDEEAPQYNFKLQVNDRDYPTEEEQGKQFGDWLNLHVGWKFYKGMLENLKYAAIRYKEE